MRLPDLLSRISADCEGSLGGAGQGGAGGGEEALRTLSTHFSLDVWGTERSKTPPDIWESPSS